MRRRGCQPVSVLRSGSWEGLFLKIRLGCGAALIHTFTSPIRPGGSIHPVSDARAECIGGRSVLTDSGFLKTKDNGVNQTWEHSDGSEVRVHKYGNNCPCPYMSGNNAHVHKEDLLGISLMI